MKKMILLTIALALYFVGVNQAKALDLRITDPNNPWSYYYQPDVKTCSLFVSPKGLYCQYDLEMAVGAISQYGNSSDSLEIQYQLNLPKSWTINDSWLWVGDTIVPAMLIDRAKATEIYESLVSRRTDPSLLTWDLNGNVNLRVYPLFKGESRRFRISFLAPADWTMDNIATEISANFFPNNLTKMDIFIRENDDFQFNKNLLINGDLANKTWFEQDTIDNMIFTKYSLYESLKSGSIKTTFERTNKSNVFFDIYQKNNEKFYQMALLHPDISENRPMKKVLFAYDVNKPSEDALKTRTKLIASMGNIINPKDSFNLLLSAMQNKFVFDKWVPATQQNLDSAVRALNSHVTNSLTYFHNTMMSIIDFVKNEHEFDISSVVFLTSDNTYNNAAKCIDEYSALKQILNYKVRINIALFYQYLQSNNYEYYNYNYYYEGRYFICNELLAKNIAAYTQGMVEMDLDYQKYDYNTNSYIYDDILPFFEAYYNQNLYGTNVQIQLQDGFSYTDNIISSNSKATLMCGKLYGESDLTVKLTGFDGVNPFIRTYPVQYSISDKKYKNNQFWSFAELGKLSKETQTKGITEEIVRLSTNNRVISQYTAFLALEPWMMNITEKYDYQNAEDNGDNGGGSTNTTDNLNSNLDVILNYNNSNNSIDIVITKSDSKVLIEAIRIYDISGRELHLWNIDEQSNELTLTWQVGDSISSGTVVVLIETNMGLITRKLNITK